MINKIIYFFIALIVVIGTLFAVYSFQNKTYIRGKYGEHCYTIKNKHPNIKHPIYFSSLQDCLNSL